MLGELVAREVRQIEHEKSHKCPGCEVNQASRAIRVFVASNECECPVCTIVKAQICQMGTKLDKIYGALRLEHERIAPLVNSAVFMAENEQDIRNAAGLEGGVTYAARVIRNLIQDYYEITDAAHATYELIAQSNVTAVLVAPSQHPDHDHTEKPDHDIN
jgi:hypothetical protein